jgi:hypothetical protein
MMARWRRWADERRLRRYERAETSGLRERVRACVGAQRLLMVETARGVLPLETLEALTVEVELELEELRRALHVTANASG